ncbi:MAG: GNAT family N-acetyltransferase [Thermoplasmata archaeon]
MLVRIAGLGDWKAISHISSISGYDDYINEMGISYLDSREVYVHESEDTIKGFIRIENLFGRSQWLSGLRVHPDYRRRGIALELTYFALKKAKEDGIHISRLLIEERNTPSLNLATKCGFTKRDCYYFLIGSPVPAYIGNGRMPETGTIVDMGWKFADICEIPPNLPVFLRSGKWVFLKFGNHYHVTAAGTSDLTFTGDGVTCISGQNMTPGLMKYVMPDFPSACVFEKQIR